MNLCWGVIWESDSGNWYLKIKNNVAEILGSLTHSAILVEWGGQVWSRNIKKHETPHKGTAMGRGRFQNACFMRNVRGLRIIRNSWSILIKDMLWLKSPTVTPLLQFSATQLILNALLLIVELLEDEIIKHPCC